ncbi:MAG: hypothetical protein H6Q33_430 [Deltaproteobacteria bacterium]|nr:hypothetical protein [Deltaproteobacteria bacterium]
MNRILLTALLMSATLATLTQAQTSYKDRVLEKYQRTGKLENCLPLGAIRETKVLGNSSVLFHMAGGDVYLNETPQPCPMLDPPQTRSFIYDTSLSKLCNTDVITVTDPGSSVPRLGSCGLGQFELLAEKAPPTKTN